MIDIERTIISQYGNSATITQLVRNMNEYIDPRADIDGFFSAVWDITSAVDFGLDIWGRIVNVKRTLVIPGASDHFGFNDGDGFYPFNEQPFYNGPEATTSYVLAAEAYRQLILVKALANISSTNSPTYNQLLQNLFATRGRCYVNDTGGMSLRFTFEFQLTDYELAIVTQSGAFPRPAGVSATILHSEFPIFGFNEAGPETAAGFGQAPFLSEGAIHAII